MSTSSDPKTCSRLREEAIDGGVVADVAFLDQLRIDALGQRSDAALQVGGGVGEAESRPFRMERLGDAPGDGALVRHADDERGLAVKQSHRAISLVEAGSLHGTCPSLAVHATRVNGDAC